MNGALTPTPGPVSPSITLAFNPTDLTHALVLLVIAALCGLIVAVLRGGAMPLGPLGGIGAALVGAWLGADQLTPRLPPIAQPTFDGVAIVPAIIGALLVAFVFSLLAGSQRRRGYY